jgi:translation initiation factor IF-3
MSIKIPKKNEEITAKEVRVVASSGEMIGVMSVREAIMKAKYAGMDLLEISPNVEPPVCKILDFGKYKYDVKKKEADAKSKQHKVEQKEIKMTPHIGEHDYQTKFKRILEFITAGHRVTVIVQLKGRERGTPEKAKEFLHKIELAMLEFASIVIPANFGGNSGSITFGPKKK